MSSPNPDRTQRGISTAQRILVLGFGLAVAVSIVIPARNSLGSRRLALVKDPGIHRGGPNARRAVGSLSASETTLLNDARLHRQFAVSGVGSDPIGERLQRGYRGSAGHPGFPSRLVVAARASNGEWSGTELRQGSREEWSTVGLLEG